MILSTISIRATTRVMRRHLLQIAPFHCFCLLLRDGLQLLPRIILNTDNSHYHPLVYVRQLRSGDVLAWLPL